MVAILVGRAVGSIGLIYFCKMFGYERGDPNELTFKELVFIWYAGMIRGAIAFGLVLKIDDSFPNKDVITTSCLFLVILTTVVCGSTIGILSKCLWKEDPQGPAECH